MAEIRINATGGVKLYDADDSHYAQIVAGTITSNVDAITLGHDTVTIADNLSLGSDSSVLKFGADGDTTLTHTDGTGLTLNSTNKICFNDASQFIQGSSNAVLSLGATDEIDLTATAVDLNGTLNVSGVATFQSTPVFPDGSLALADLDIDGGTDIGAAIVDADLFIVDDGAGGTNRKVTASRIKTYAGTSSIGDITDVSMDITNFTDGILIQPNSDGSAPTTGTLNGANENVGIGNAVFTALTSADNCVGIGSYALDALTTGGNNVALGYLAGSSQVDGTGNTYLGYGSGYVGTGGSNNVFVGVEAGRDTTSGENIAIGYQAALANTSGADIIAIGENAYDAADTESSNIAIGKSALGGSVAGGELNVAIGHDAGGSLTSADGDVIIGYQAGERITTGGYNTFAGYQAGDHISTGSSTVCIGKGTDGSAVDVANAIAIGDTVTAASNDFSFGKSGNVVTNDFDADADWSRSSDLRLKRNIQDSTLGLDFINDLRPIKFQWKPSNEVPKEMKSEYNEVNQKNLDIVSHGFIAQEVKEAVDKHGDTTFGGWHLDKTDNETQRVKKNMFVMPLIKAVQELTARVKELEDK